MMRGAPGCDGSAAGHAGAEQSFRDAVHDEVGIAANGRGEMGVGGRGQGEVAFVDLGVSRLGERAQHEVTEDALFRLAFDARGEFLIHARRDGDVFWHFKGAGGPAGALRRAAVLARDYALDGQRPKAERVAEGSGQLFELDDTARFGFLVDAVERGHAEIFKPCGDALVRGKHELFDEAIGPGTLRFRHAAHLAVLVELDDGFGQVKINRPALFTALIHEDGEALHALKVWNEGCVAGARRGVALEDCVDIRVGHPLCRTDHALDDLETLDAARGVELHDATEDEAVFIRAQAADVRRKLLRQHGNGAIGEVDAGAAQAGFEVESRVGANILGYVGDVDFELVTGAVGAFAHQNRIVEVARGFTVDGDDGQRAKVGPARCFSGIEMCDAARFGEDVLGKDPRQLVLANHYLDVDAEVVGRAEYFDHAAYGRARRRGPTGDFDIDDQGPPGFQVLDEGDCPVPSTRCGVGAAGGISAPGGMRMGWVMRSSKGTTTLFLSRSARA